MRIDTPIIDADGHIIERDSDIRRYMGEPWDKWPSALTPGGRPWNQTLFNTLGDEHLFRGVPPEKQVERWVAVCEELGIEKAFLFPTGTSRIGALEDPEFAQVVCRARNDFVAREFNSLSDRIAVVGLLPVRHPEAAARELRRCVTELGFQGFCILSLGLPKALGDPFYDPIYREAEALGAAICIHGTRAFSEVQLSADALSTFSEVHTWAFPAGLMMQFTSVVYSGLPIRFPKLRLAFLEVGATWLPYYLDRMDEHYEKRGEAEMPLLKRRPSELVRESSIFFSIESGESQLPQTIEYLGDRHFLYASDYPHWDNEFPGNIETLWRNEALSRETKERILYHNAKVLFG